MFSKVSIVSFKFSKLGNHLQYINFTQNCWWAKLNAARLVGQVERKIIITNLFPENQNSLKKTAQSILCYCQWTFDVNLHWKGEEREITGSGKKYKIEVSLWETKNFTESKTDNVVLFEYFISLEVNEKLPLPIEKFCCGTIEVNKSCTPKTLGS